MTEPAAAAPASATVTLVVVSYNQQAVLRQAVESALAQDHSPLQVVLSDDASTDASFDIMRDMAAAYTGPHEIVLNRNPTNLGLARHLNRAMELATGSIVAAAAGDDISEPNRITRTVSYMSAHPLCYSLDANSMVIDENGVAVGPWGTPGAGRHPVTLERLARGGAGVWGFCHAWRRELFDVFGPMQDGVLHEDICIPFRALLLGEVHHLDEILLRYRRHGANLSRDRGYATAALLHAYRRREARASVAARTTMLKDLELQLARSHGAVAGRLRRVARLARRSRQIAEREVELLDLATRSARLEFMARALVSGVPPRRIARWLSWEFLERRYLAPAPAAQ